MKLYWCVHDFQCLSYVSNKGLERGGYHCQSITSVFFFWCISQLYTECRIQAARGCESLLHDGWSYVVFKLCSEVNTFVPVQLVCETAKWLPWPGLCTVGSAGNQDCVGPNGQKMLCCSANNVHEICNI